MSVAAGVVTGIFSWFHATVFVELPNNRRRNDRFRSHNFDINIAIKSYCNSTPARRYQLPCNLSGRIIFFLLSHFNKKQYCAPKGKLGRYLARLE